MASDPGPLGPTSQDRIFYGMLLASVVALAAVFAPFLYVLLVAALIVVVTWSPYRGLVVRVGGRPRLAAALMTAGVLLVLAVPVAGVGALAVREASNLMGAGMQLLAGEELQAWSMAFEERYAAVRELARLEGVLPEPHAVVVAVLDWGESVLLDLSRSIGSGMPGLVGRTGRVGMDLVVFCLALAGFYAHGAALTDGLRDLIPLEDAYVDRLFAVFRQFSSNVLVGMVAAGAAQGAVAAVGFWIAGVKPVVALGVATAVMSVVPFIGSAVVWVPTAVALGLGGSPGWAVFVVGWSLGLTASVDNLVRPLVLRSGLQVGPTPMLLSLFGGVLTLGAKGLVLGPLAVLLFYTLFTLYRRDYLQRPEA